MPTLTQGQQVEIYYICVEQSKNAQNKTMESDANLCSSSAGLLTKNVGLTEQKYRNKKWPKLTNQNPIYCFSVLQKSSD